MLSSATDTIPEWFDDVSVGSKPLLVIVVLAFAYSEWIGSKISATGMRAISKIVSLLLAAIAVNMIRHGWAG